MRLNELDPQWLRWQDDKHWRWRRLGNPDHSDGILFLCPKCFVANHGAVGTHSVICWKPHIPQTTQPAPGRWDMTGTGFSDLTLVAGSSSVQITGGCEAHFFIENGNIRMV